MGNRIASCPVCGNVPRIGYCMGEHFVIGTVRCNFCETWNVMSASEEQEIKRWNERVKEERNGRGDM